MPSQTASPFPPTSQNCDSERPGQAVLSLGASGQEKRRAFERTHGNPDLVLKPKMRHVTSTSELVPSCYNLLHGDIPPHMETVSLATYQHQFKRTLLITGKYKQLIFAYLNRIKRNYVRVAKSLYISRKAGILVNYTRQPECAFCIRANNYVIV